MLRALDVAAASCLGVLGHLSLSLSLSLGLVRAQREERESC